MYVQDISIIEYMQHLFILIRVLTDQHSIKVAFADGWRVVDTNGNVLEVEYDHHMSLDDGVYIHTKNSANTTIASSGDFNEHIRIINHGYAWDRDERSECAIFHNGSMGCEGLNEYSNHPGYLDRAWIEPPSGKNHAAVISKYGEMTCMVLDDGTAECFGNNQGPYVGDGTTCVYGTSDPIGCTSGNYVNSPYPSLPTGRHIALGEMDLDGDGIADIIDLCPTSSITWTSDSSTDNDQDGCRDSDEDNGGDNDGYLDSEDTSPTNPMLPLH